VRPPAPAPPPARRSLVVPIALAVAGLAIAAVATALVVHARRPARERAEPSIQHLLNSATLSSASLTRDGTHLAYLDEGKLHLRDLETGVDRTYEVPGRPRWVTAFPDGDRVLIQSEDPDGLCTRHIYRPSTGAYDRINVPPDCGSDAISPDGRKLAYEDVGKVRVLDLTDGSGVTLAGAPQLYDLAWSPSGNHILYANARQAFLVGLDGKEPRRIDAMENAIALSWAPKGDVVFDNMKGGHDHELVEVRVDEETGATTARRVLMSADGPFTAISTGARRAVVGELESTNELFDYPISPPGPPKAVMADLGQVDWAPDGFVVTTMKTGNADIYFRDATGNMRPILVSKGVRKGVWAVLPTGVIASVSNPDQSMTFLFVSWNGEQRALFTDQEGVARVACSPAGCLRTHTDDDNVLHISRLDLDHPDRRSETSELATVRLDDQFESVEFSPDGNALALSEPPKLLVIDVASGAKRELNVGRSSSPSWYPDSAHLLLTNNRSQEDGTTVGELLRVGLDGSTEVVVSNPSHMFYPPHISPDGRHVAVVGGALHYALIQIDDLD
jgi:Tol biopolymer transport system component